MSMETTEDYMRSQMVRRGKEFHIDLCWPRNEENIDSFVVNLMDVRASDGIRISYDFDRDGWKAFVKSWQHGE